jgi:iron complex outermembrane receptor protein
VDGFDYGSYPTDGVNYQKLETKGGNIRLKYNLNDITLHSITGYETLKFNSRADVDGGYGAVFAPPSGPGYIPFPVETADLLPNHKQFSQEFRAESNYAGPLQWIGGLFFFNESIQIDSISFDSFTPGNPQNAAYAQQFQNAKSWAAFGSLNYTVTDKFKVRGGLRYTTTRKSSRPPASNRRRAGPFEIDNTSHNTSWDLSGTYELDKNTNLFARVATGYRAPSMQGRLNGLGDKPSFAGAEKALSYEAGIKQDLFDKRARLSAAVFQYRVKDKQLTAGSGSINMNQLINAEKVTGQGLELDLGQPAAASAARSATATTTPRSRTEPVRAVLRQLRQQPDPRQRLHPDQSGRSVCRYVQINGNPLPRAPKSKPTSRSSTAPILAMASSTPTPTGPTAAATTSSCTKRLSTRPSRSPKAACAGLQMGRRQV